MIEFGWSNSDDQIFEWSDKGAPFGRNNEKLENDRRQLEERKHHLPEYKNKEDEQQEEHRDVIERAQHDHQLPPQGRHEPDEFEYPEQTKRTQYGQATAALLLHQLHYAKGGKRAKEN